MGFWEEIGGIASDHRAQRAVDSAFEQGKAQGQQDMTRWCHNLQAIIFEEAASSVAQRVVLDKALEELRRLDPNNWLLVRDNRIRIAADVRKEAGKDDYAQNGIATPTGYAYFRRPDGFLERRHLAEGEVVGVVRQHGGKATAMTMEEVGLAAPE